jgi:hypothetical protein
MQIHNTASPQTAGHSLLPCNDSCSCSSCHCYCRPPLPLSPPGLPRELPPGDSSPPAALAASRAASACIAFMRAISSATMACEQVRIFEIQKPRSDSGRKRR